VVYGTSSFAGNVDISSQMGGVIALRDGTDNLHLLHWFSNKLPLVKSSVLAEKAIVFVTIYDIATSLKKVLQQILARRVESIFSPTATRCSQLLRSISPCAKKGC
jgi:hypothetical protein